MSKSDERRCTRVYHALVATLMLIAGAGLLGFGIWLTASGHKVAHDLRYGDDNIFNLFLRVNNGAMILGGFLIAASIVSMIALAKNCLGVTFRVIYVIIAVIIFLALAATCVLASLILRFRHDDTIRDFVRDAWRLTVTEQQDVICSLEKELGCRGFDNDDCVTCATGEEPECDGVVKAVCVKGCGNPAVDPSRGCFDRMIDELFPAMLPVAIASGVLALVVLVDMFVMCCI